MNSLQVTLPIRTASDLQASASGTMIRNEFELVAEAHMEACLCHGSPSNKIEAKIFNKCFQAPALPQQFVNWSPQLMQAQVFTITDQFRMTNEFKANAMYQNVSYPIA